MTTRTPQDYALKTFRPVIGWEGFYEVSNLGEVRSLPRVIRRSDGTVQTFPGKPLKAMVSNNGYLVVRLSRPEQRKTARVHRLVATAFLPNPGALPEVNHIDGVKTNPRFDNLEWCTSSQNRHHAYHVLGSITMPRNYKLTFSDAQRIRKEHIPGIFARRRQP